MSTRCCVPQLHSLKGMLTLACLAASSFPVFLAKYWITACRPKLDKQSAADDGKAAKGDAKSGLAVTQPQEPLSPVPFLPNEVLQVIQALRLSSVYLKQ